MQITENARKNGGHNERYTWFLNYSVWMNSTKRAHDDFKATCIYYSVVTTILTNLHSIIVTM